MWKKRRIKNGVRFLAIRGKHHAIIPKFFEELG
jgi:hypothetical protein